MKVYIKTMSHIQIIAEYVCIGGNGELYSKTKILQDFKIGHSGEVQNFPK